MTRDVVRGRDTVRWIAALILLGGAAATLTADHGTQSTLPWQIEADTWGPKAVHGSTLFIGSAAKPTPAANLLTGTAVFPPGDGVPIAAHATNERVSVAIPDGSGGWYLGGSFTTMNGVPRLKLAHVLASGATDPAFVADVTDPNGSVRALLLAGGQLFVGGFFSTVNLVTRSNLAVVDAASGRVAAAAPSANGSVRSLTRVGTNIIAGGDFTTAGGQARVGLAAFDATSGALVTGFTANTNNPSTVWVVASDGTAVYAGGSFQTVNGVPRAQLVKVDGATGSVDATWNPGANAAVFSLAVTAGSVFAGGAFTQAGGQPRIHLAALDTATGAALPWRADINGNVSGLQVDNGALYTTGNFSTAAGVLRRFAAAISVSAPARVLPWNPSFRESPEGVTSGGGLIAVFGGAGGTLGGWGVRNGSGLAAVDLVTGELLPWAPVVNGVVRAITIAGTRLLVAGTFTDIDGFSRANLAAFDLDTLQLLPLSVSINGPVGDIAVIGNVLYVGGSFTQVNGATRLNLAAIDLTTSAVLPWDPQADASVLTLLARGDRLLLGGTFTSLIGAAPFFGFYTRSGLGEITTAGAVTPFTATIAPANVSDLGVAGSTVFMTGSFTSVQGTTRNRAAALDGGTAALLPWNPDLDATAEELAFYNGEVLLAGRFATAGGQSHPGLVRVNATTGAAAAWTPLGSGARARGLAVTPAGLAVSAGPPPGGAFLTARFLPELALGGTPGPPSLPVARTVGSNLTIAWEPPVIGARPTGYVLEAGTARGLANLGTLPLSTTNFSVGGVPPGTFYARVRAVGAGGVSAPSRELAFTVGSPGCTAAPQPVLPPQITVANGVVTFSWEPGVGAAPSAYTLLAGTQSGVADLGVLPVGPATSFSVNGVPAGVYFLRLVAANACGTSEPSGDAVLRVGGAPGPPSPPLQLGATVAPGGVVTLSWLTPGTAGVPSGHVLEAGTGPGLSNLGLVPLSAATSLSVAGVPSGTYYLRLRAVNTAGNSAPSGELLLVVP